MKRIFVLVMLFAAADVKYRQTVMKSMGAHMTAMSLVVKKEVAMRSQLGAHAEAIHALSATIPEMFPAPDKVRSSAKPEIWTHFDEFKSLSARLERESATLSQLAAKRDWKSFDAQFARVAKTCEDCHDKFRVQD